MPSSRGSDRRGHSEQDERIQRSLKACWKEGMLSQVMLGTLDTYLVPFALFLGARGTQIGLLTAVPNLLGSLSQFVAVKAVHVAGNRYRLIIAILLAQFIFLLPIGFLGYAEFNGRILTLLVLISGFKGLGSLMGPAWGSLVSEYLPPERRGDYFGFRSRVVGISGLVGMAFWGAFLWLWNKQGPPATGFMILFVCCTFLRGVSLYYMRQLHDLPMEQTQESNFTFWEFVRRFRESNFVKFVFFVAGITFAIQLAAPYFAVYILKELKFSYLSFMIVNVAGLLAGLISFTLWGRHSDAVGTARILKLTGLLLPLSPILWTVARTPLTLSLVEFAGGFVWGGFNLCAVNFIYDAVQPSKRVRCLGYFNLINGTAAFAGASIGGVLSERMPEIMGSRFVSLFLLSAALRFAVNLFLSPHFREVRAAAGHHVPYMRLFFSVVGIKPLLGPENELLAPVPAAEEIHYGDRDRPDRRSEPREAGAERRS